MKRGTSVRVTDPQSANFGKVGTFLFKANENYVHVNIDEQVHTFHRLAVAPCNTYTPPIQDEKLKAIAVRLEKLYNLALNKEEASNQFGTEYARGMHATAKQFREELYKILNGK